MSAELEKSPTEAEESGGMSLLEHLDELRRRLLWAAGGITLSFLLCWWKAEVLFDWCVAPYREVVGEDLSVVAVGEGFLTQLRVAFVCSLFLSAPWWMWQAWAFVRPGLYPKERRLAIPFVVLTSGFFALGGWFTYSVGLPAMLDYLVNVASQGFEKDIRAESYMSIFGHAMIGMGVVFEAPVLTFFLARMGLVSHSFLLKKSRIATVIVFVLAAVITPTPDIPTMLLFAIPMTGLFWLSVIVAWVFRRRPA